MEETLPDASRNKYRWVILVVCTVLITLAYGLMFSYSVFFKPLASHFHWDRAQTSTVYSVSLLLRGLFSIGVGWLADRFGARLLLAAGGVITFLAFMLSSQVHSLHGFFFTYGILLAIGLSGAFGISTSLVAKWFGKRSGLALGIVSMGSGLGTLLVVPASAKLVNTYPLSTTFMICGTVGGAIMFLGAMLLREAPPSAPDNQPANSPGQKNVPFSEALRHPELYLICTVMFIFVFCAQVITIHFVNYATDFGMTPLKAAGIVSLIGLVSMAGRLLTGVMADRTDPFNLMLIAPAITFLSFMILIFAKAVPMIYLFAVIYALAYGAEVPLPPLMAKRYFGTKSLATLVGVFLFAGGVGGAAGPLVAGKTFDVTHSYHTVFVLGAISLIFCLIPIAILKARSKREAPMGNLVPVGPAH